MSIKPKREFRLRPRKGSSKYVGLCCRRRLSHILNVFTATYGEKDSQIILRFPGAAPKNAFLLLLTCCTHFYGHAQVQQRGTVREKKRTHSRDPKFSHKERNISNQPLFALLFVLPLFFSPWHHNIQLEHEGGRERKRLDVSL